MCLLLCDFSRKAVGRGRNEVVITKKSPCVGATSYDFD